MKKWLVALCVLAGLVLVACGGGSSAINSLGNLASGGEGGGVGSGGTGISGGSVGYVAGFGSIYVNGTRYDISSASMSVADDTELKLGMSVKVLGTVATDYSTGVATSVESEADVMGQVSSINTANGTLVVQGLTISTDSETVLDGVTALSGLSSGNWVKVYGQVWFDAQLNANQMRASRIEKLATTPTSVVLSGAISQLNKTSQQFSVGGITVNYNGATFSGGVDASTISNGMVVRVRSSSGPVSGVLTASSIKLWYPLALVDNAPLSVDGVVGSFTALNSFKVLGYTVDASNATFGGGTSSTLTNGVKVEVTGVLHNGLLVASSVTIRQVPGTSKPARYTATGPIVQYNASTSTFKVQGQSIDASSNSVTFSGLTRADLNNQVKVTVVGSQVLNGVLIADSISKP